MKVGKGRFFFAGFGVDDVSVPGSGSGSFGKFENNAAILSSMERVVVVVSTVVANVVVVVVVVVVAVEVETSRVDGVKGTEASVVGKLITLNAEEVVSAERSSCNRCSRALL